MKKGPGEDPNLFYLHLKLALYHGQSSPTDTSGVICTFGIPGKVGFFM